MMNELDHEHNAPSRPPVYVGLRFTYNGRLYEVEQILAGNRAICHSFYHQRNAIILQPRPDIGRRM